LSVGLSSDQELCGGQSPREAEEPQIKEEEETLDTSVLSLLNQEIDMDQVTLHPHTDRESKHNSIPSESGIYTLLIQYV
jgi:hypothetical protein